MKLSLYTLQIAERASELDAKSVDEVMKKIAEKVCVDCGWYFIFIYSIYSV